ncbi:hypothetical protein GCG54_00007919 [Colletotrichum gloeosporioides]|uniref:Uncharacterized protein n=1 Tax=Colletotrichum gloeosporioides TaxID=474922 RepID=A0A8H4CQ65_COLGL|nr:uncharacterized protein GCG54_00007919 [Colletotrichum gloeosporioides]KAF3808138.1 hypothetical protein GCG54_00007919 [Colletotrichum gloeosporioides]
MASVFPDQFATVSTTNQAAFTINAGRHLPRHAAHQLVSSMTRTVDAKIALAESTRLDELISDLRPSDRIVIVAGTTFYIDGWLLMDVNLGVWTINYFVDYIPSNDADPRPAIQNAKLIFAMLGDNTETLTIHLNRMTDRTYAAIWMQPARGLDLCPGCRACSVGYDSAVGRHPWMTTLALCLEQLNELTLEEHVAFSKLRDLFCWQLLTSVYDAPYEILQTTNRTRTLQSRLKSLRNWRQYNMRLRKLLHYRFSVRALSITTAILCQQSQSPLDPTNDNLQHSLEDHIEDDVSLRDALGKEDKWLEGLYPYVAAIISRLVLRYAVKSFLTEHRLLRGY